MTGHGFTRITRGSVVSCRSRLLFSMLVVIAGIGCASEQPRERSHERAVSRLERAPADRVERDLAMADAALKIEDRELAQLLYTNVLAARPCDLIARWRAGLVSFQLKRYAEAEHHLKCFIEGATTDHPLR